MFKVFEGGTDVALIQLVTDKPVSRRNEGFMSWETFKKLIRSETPFRDFSG